MRLAWQCLVATTGIARVPLFGTGFGDHASLADHRSKQCGSADGSSSRDASNAPRARLAVVVNGAPTGRPTSDGRTSGTRG